MPTLEKVIWDEINTDGTNTRHSGFLLTGHGIMVRKQGNNLIAYYGKKFNCQIVNIGLEPINQWSLNFGTAAIKLARAVEDFQKHQTEFESLFEQLKETGCICPKECDCENPPPDDWDGVSGSFGVSEECPIHNDNPRVAPDCPVHDSF